MLKYACTCSKVKFHLAYLHHLVVLSSLPSQELMKIEKAECVMWMDVDMIALKEVWTDWIV